MKNIAHQQLRILMAKHIVSPQDISNVIGKTYKQTFYKLRGTVKFDLAEAWKIKEFFRTKGEDVTIDAIFFPPVDSNESKPA